MINDIITDSLKLILVSSICLFLMNRLGIILANRCFKAINNYGSYSPFKLTKGDKKKNDKIISQNQKQINIFISNSIFTIVLNIFSALIA